MYSCSASSCSLFGFECGGNDADDDRGDGEALGEDAAPHQQLWLPGFALVERSEAIHQRSRRPQATLATYKKVALVQHAFITLVGISGQAIIMLQRLTHAAMEPILYVGRQKIWN